MSIILLKLYAKKLSFLDYPSSDSLIFDVNIIVLIRLIDSLVFPNLNPQRNFHFQFFKK